jgi:2,3-bisphosphoglycerate-independent phosphoglycerate mutase
MAPYLNHAAKNPVPQMIRKSWPLLEAHPVNLERRNKGLKEANSIWLWGQGKPPQMPTFEERYGLKGGVISAVDLLKGIGVYAGFVPIHVEGATGYIDTNYVGKAEAALDGLQSLDFIFLHVEAPDEAGHHGDYEEKIRAIEYFDERVVGTVLKGLRQFDDYRIMVVSDHFTPVVKRTHTEEPPPFAWAGEEELGSKAGGKAFSEKQAAAGGIVLDSGEALMRTFLDRV